MKTITLGLAAACIAAVATPAFAGMQELPTQKVSIAGLDLETAEGQRILDRRIDRAARSVCGADEAKIGSRRPSASSIDCVAKARANAMRQIATVVETRRLGG